MNDYITFISTKDYIKNVEKCLNLIDKFSICKNADMKMAKLYHEKIDKLPRYKVTESDSDKLYFKLEDIKNTCGKAAWYTKDTDYKLSLDFTWSGMKVGFKPEDLTKLTDL